MFSKIRNWDIFLVRILRKAKTKEILSKNIIYQGRNEDGLSST